MSFPSFHGTNYENASYFLHDLEMAFLASAWDTNEVKLKAFPLVMRDKAKVWFQGLTAKENTDWVTLKGSFLMKYVTHNTPEKLWPKLTCLHQDNLASYWVYEAQIPKLWTEWEASLNKGERAPNFLQKERFLARLNPLLQEKVQGKFPETFDKARQWARAKDQKLQF